MPVLVNSPIAVINTRREIQKGHSAKRDWIIQPCLIKSKTKPCRVGSVGSVSTSRMVGREFASGLGHTKDHHKNGTNCLPAWHAMR